MAKKELEEKECEICGVWFKPSRRTQKYCPECGKHSDNARRNMSASIRRSIAHCGTGKDPEPITNICMHCGKEFQTWLYKKDFCCKECQTNYQIAHTVCPECGRSMADCGIHELISPWYCSDECKEKWKWKQAKKQGHVHTCLYCKKEFIRNTPGTFCSKDCYRKAVSEGWRPDNRKYRICPECGRQFPENGAQLYCSESCKEHAMRKINKPKIVPRSQSEKKLDNYIEENGLCSICCTPYNDCERMSSNFRMSPKGAVFRHSLVIKCPKYTSKKKGKKS